MGTEVSVGNVDLGLFNRLVIDDIAIKDTTGADFISTDRTAIKIDLLPLLNGKISISNAQLFGLTAHLTKADSAAVPNYQFLIDALSSKDDKESKPLNLNVNSFILRRGNITYDILDKPKKATLDTNHLNLRNLDATVSVKTLTDDSLDVIVKRFNVTEQNSDLRIKNLSAKLQANKEKALLTDFNLKMPLSSVNIDTLSAEYPTFTTDGKYRFSTKIAETHITPADAKAIMPQLASLTSPLYLDTKVDGTQDALSLQQLTLHTDDNSIDIDLDADIMNLNSDSPQFNTNIRRLFASNEGRNIILGSLAPELANSSQLATLGDAQFSGFVSKQGGGYAADGTLSTDVGNISLDAEMTGDNYINGHVNSDGIVLTDILQSNDLGTVAFDMNLDGHLDANNDFNGKLNGIINSLQYKDYTYNNINIDAEKNGDLFDGSLLLADPNITAAIQGNYHTSTSAMNIDADVKHINPHALNLTDKLSGETYSMRLRADLNGNNLNNLAGNIGIDSLHVATADTVYSLDNLSLSIDDSDNKKHIQISSDFIDANLSGNIRIDEVAAAFQNQIAHHLPSLLSHSGRTDNAFDFDITMRESDLLHHYIDTDITFPEPIHLKGFVDSPEDIISCVVTAPSVRKGDTNYTNTSLTCMGSSEILSLNAVTSQERETGPLQLHLTADAKNDELHTLLDWKGDSENTNTKTKAKKNDDKKPILNNGMLYAVTQFGDSLGKMKADISLHKSQFEINDTVWYVEPSHIDILGKKIQCDNVRIYNDEQSIQFDGIISDNPSDSLLVSLHNLQVEYITDLVDFHAVRFKGKASGNATVSHIYDEPHLSANIIVNDMHLQEGRLGTGYIQAFWDKEISGIRVNGHIVDNYQGLDRTTNVSGFIAPSKNDINLRIDTYNTNAEFLEGFLSSTFRDFKGSTNGTLNVIGPLNDVNLVGDISADVSMRLRATNTLYHINPADTIRLRPYAFRFDDIHLTDASKGVAVVNGTLSHKNMKNFKYDFDISMTELTIYDEKEFNSDKFLATVFASGNMSLHGSDGHPLRITADITPTKGSVFAYDAATPDAISSSNFVEFREKKPSRTSAWTAEGYDFNLNKDEKEDEGYEDDMADYEYDSDIFMDIRINVTPDCEIKLRMDNVDDGYMSTYGTGTLLAHYHDKSPFTLNGIYQIQGGKYRLYLQDIIYRDLELQPGSNVVFNGNPFDANIHLICWHTINSVPLRDLTSTTSTLSSSSKVKVVCVLDITGQLGNMNFGFDLLLPNVNDETRQLVRSLISTEEEMNMQMIYLLGLGRFYTNEYARANGETGTNQAVNTLLSSTISGQVNQMLSNVIGTDSKWNFGTGLSTGEQGWNDLDVEGILSGRLLNDRLLINGNFGYRDNALTNNANFIGDFDIKWRLTPDGNTYIKAYNQTNDRYFTKATLNTQGIGITYQRDFDTWRELFRRKMKEEKGQK